MPPADQTGGFSRRREAISSKDVATWIRDRIRLGKLVPGQRLVEADIMAEARVSRRKVRDAFQRLETEGLVTIEEFRGASVRRFSFDEVRQIYRARMALEGLAAAEFAAHGTPDDKRRLAELQEELDAWSHSGDQKRFAALNDAWHALIIDGSRNRHIREFLTRLTVPIYRLLFFTFYSKSRIENANADHRIITQAILDGRQDDAERAMRQHLQHGLNAIADIDARLYD